MKSCRFAGIFGVVRLFAAANPGPAAVEDPDTRPTGVASTPDGALMLEARARAELLNLLRFPQLLP